jgi:glycosyltransferase involved in cell wall biosynthesis
VATRARGGNVLFVLPEFRSHSAAVRSSWMASSELARTLGRHFGQADMLTPFGLLSPEEVINEAVQVPDATAIPRRALLALPQLMQLAAGELQIWYRAHRMRRVFSLIDDNSYAIVVQLHHRYQTCGLALARRLSVPLVLRVDALEVREEASWGLQRPGWGRLVEHLGEVRLIRRADLIVSVSDTLDKHLADSVHAHRRLVLPNGVNLDLFHPGPKDKDLLRGHGLEGRFVVGWTGGFRPYHGLQAVPEIARRLKTTMPEAVLCFLGTGSMRGQLHDATEEVRDSVVLLDPVRYEDVPRWVRSFDACMLLGGSADYHYSPLKLYEYMACQRPVIGPSAGEISNVLGSGRGYLVPPNDPDAVVDAIVTVAKDPNAAAEVAHRARVFVEGTASWDARSTELMRALRDRGLVDENALLLGQGAQSG